MALVTDPHAQPPAEPQLDDSRATDKPKELPPYHLDGNSFVAQLWEEFVMRKKRQIEDKKWTDAYQKKIYEQSQNRPLHLNGAKVASYTQDGNFTETWFHKEQPELAREYTRPVTEMKLDREALLRDHPKVYEQYRAPTMRIENNPTATP